MWRLGWYVEVRDGCEVNRVHKVTRVNRGTHLDGQSCTRSVQPCDAALRSAPYRRSPWTAVQPRVPPAPLLSSGPPLSSQRHSPL